MTSDVMVLGTNVAQINPMNSPTTLSRVQAASAIYDVLLAGIFALPVLAAFHLDTVLRHLHVAFGAIGVFSTFEPFHLLFVNLFGGLTIAWSTVRFLRKSDSMLAVADAWLRYYFAFVMLTYITVWEAPALLYAFVASEVIWASILLWVARSAEPQPSLSGHAASC